MQLNMAFNSIALTCTSSMVYFTNMHTCKQVNDHYVIMHTTNTWISAFSFSTQLALKCCWILFRLKNREKNLLWNELNDNQQEAIATLQLIIKLVYTLIIRILIYKTSETESKSALHRPYQSHWTASTAYFHISNICVLLDKELSQPDANLTGA